MSLRVYMPGRVLVVAQQKALFRLQREVADVVHR